MTLQIKTVDIRNVVAMAQRQYLGHQLKTVVACRRNRKFSSFPSPAMGFFEDDTENEDDHHNTSRFINNINIIRTTARATPRRRLNGLDSPQFVTVEDTNQATLSQIAAAIQRGENATHDELHESPATVTYITGETIPITSKLHIIKPEEGTPSGTWPIFRLMDENGRFRNPSQDGYCQTGSIQKTRVQSIASVSAEHCCKEDLDLLRSHLASRSSSDLNLATNPLLQSSIREYSDTASTNTLLRAHRLMVRLREMDDILNSAQRQGRISFYLTCRGEEAIHMGAGAALEVGDTILAQYREQGLLLWRGFTLEQIANQCLSNDRDLGKGRQMPIHYGSRALNYQTISSPLGTQLPQAVGSAYKYKIEGRPNIAIAFFGEGCASTNDFHSACSFASTLKVPCIFFCRNNGYAISTPSKEQYAGDGVISRCKGYGMAGIRIDGNDVFAVAAAVRKAKEYALENSAPVLIEAMTYRQGHHSTSDDSSQYRDSEEVKGNEEHGDPMRRFNMFLDCVGWMSEADAEVIRKEERKSVLKALHTAEKRGPPPLKDMFEDVYKEMPKSLMEQQKSLEDHMAKYASRYTQ